MSTILITGASGYLGQHLARQFAQGRENQVHAVVREGSAVELLRGLAQCWVYDGSYSSLDKIFAGNKIDLVVHLAALATYDTSAHNIEQLVQSNLMLGIFLLQAMSTYGCRHLINTGTYWQHYSGEAYNPVCLYAAMKEAFEQIIEFYVQAENLSAITLKLTDVYGPNDPRKKLFHYLAEAQNASAPLMMSDGEQFVNLLYIQDAVDAYMRAAAMLMQAQRRFGKMVFFVASSETKKLKEVVGLYRELCSSRVNIALGGKSHRTREVMAPFIGEILPGWQPKTSLAAGIRKVLHDVS